MISLKQKIIQQSPSVNDLGDFIPFGEKVRSKIIDIPNFDALYDHISFALHSNNKPLIVWALSQYPSACISDKRCLQMIPQITTLFSSSSVTTEYAAINCISCLVKNVGKIVAAPLLNVLLDRISNNPAIEYANCLAIIMPFFTKESVQSCIIPIIINLLQKDLAFHYQVGELLVNTNVENFGITTEQFMKIIVSPVIGEKYLAHIIKNFKNVFSKEWVSKIMPMQLLQIAKANKHLRLGYIKAILQLQDIIQNQYFMNFIVTACSWEDESEEIAVSILLKCEEIINTKTADLLSNIKKLYLNVIKSNLLQTRLQIPKILAKCQAIFLGVDFDYCTLYKSLATDKNIDIRLAFLDAFFVLYSKTKNQSTQNILSYFFLSFFKENSLHVQEKLCSSIVYSTIGHKNLEDIVPVFLNMMISLKKWRGFADALHTFVNFPKDILFNNWRVIFPIAVEKLSASNALIMPFIEFIGRVSILLQSIDNEINNLVEELIVNFFQSPKSQMREKFPIIASSLCTPLFDIKISIILWNYYKMLLDDPIPSVRANVVRYIISYRQHFLRCDNNAMEKEALNLYQASFGDSDPLVITVWESCKQQHNELTYVATTKPPLNVPNVKDPTNKSLLMSRLALPNKGKGKVPFLITQNIMSANSSSKFVQLGKSRLSQKKVRLNRTNTAQAVPNFASINQSSSSQLPLIKFNGDI